MSRPNLIEESLMSPGFLAEREPSGTSDIRLLRTLYIYVSSRRFYTEGSISDLSREESFKNLATGENQWSSFSIYYFCIHSTQSLR